MTPAFALAVDDPAVVPYPLERAVTVGRHLDNDLVLAGEDVRDFHLRVELLERGPRLTALEQATVQVDDRVVEESHGLMPGDVILIGHHRIRVELFDPGPTWGWTIHDMRQPKSLALIDEVLVGRGDGCALRLKEGHVSRRHAVIKRIGNTVWVKDLGSSNGTYVNGERVVGARRLFHGDDLAFDLFRYQLIGDDPELTPIRPPGEVPIDAFEDPVPADAERAQPRQAEPKSSVVATQHRAPTVPTAAFPALVEYLGEREVRSHALKLGRQVLGRGATADVHLVARDVADRHAEVELRADGASLIHLAPGAVTLLNHKPVSTARLEEGDVLEIGNVRLRYRATPPRRRFDRRVLLAGIAALTIVAWVVAWLLLR